MRRGVRYHQPLKGCKLLLQENFDKREKKAQITFPLRDFFPLNSSQIAWKIVPLRHFFPLKVVPLIEVLLYIDMQYIYSSISISRTA
jgi:hypothetical protein